MIVCRHRRETGGFRYKLESNRAPKVVWQPTTTKMHALLSWQDRGFCLQFYFAVWEAQISPGKILGDIGTHLGMIDSVFFLCRQYCAMYCQTTKRLKFSVVFPALSVLPVLTSPYSQTCSWLVFFKTFWEIKKIQPQNVSPPSGVIFTNLDPFWTKIPLK